MSSIADAYLEAVPAERVAPPLDLEMFVRGCVGTSQQLLSRR